jgi:MerR family transcriptional regulator/heat shock protein HspR
MSNEEHSDDEAVYVISIASQLSGMHPQTLRQYDRMGLVSPGRASGRGRRYSLLDIASLRNIQRLVGEGINLAGIKRIMELESAVASMALEVAKLRTEVDALIGDPTKAELELKWKAKTHWKELAELMVDADMTS